MPTLISIINIDVAGIDFTGELAGLLAGFNHDKGRMAQVGGGVVHSIT
jgi:hypothetical protein